MSTISKKHAEQIIAADGYYLDDPRVIKVVSYTNAFNGNTLYAIVYHERNQMKYEDSEFCTNVKTLWEA